jgi:2-polyprenyl-3-methyl-5-hydroxy-6-metoxy-1,4-benzoquinol methylase
MGYHSNFRSEMLQFIPLDRRRILEVGCGEGFFGEALIHRQNAEVWGLEPNSSAANEAKKRLSRVINAEFGDKNVFPRASFDCIVFNDVLEHMYDPWRSLAFAKTLLKSRDGIIVASIPNIRYWHNLIELILKKEWEYRDEGILDRTHVRFFTKKSVSRLFDQAGLNIQKIQGINPTKDKKFKLLNFIVGGSIQDMRYLQFAVVASEATAKK